ncbi:hypothetical protein WJX72_010576 [[Myrmecia] bisecta]|uniref:Amidinotransferase n=1 Tax=[Myrmecia] bisecta TaxID=41462 RepID=A0AAW1Q6A5_9CHLO
MLYRLSSVPEAVSAAFQGEAVRVSSSGPTLVQLPERSWGPTATVPASAISSVAGTSPARVGIVRDTFAPYDQEPRQLSSAVASLGDAGVAVASALSEPHNRLIVDEYELGGDGQYELKDVGTDLFRLLHREGVHAAYVPDVAAAGRDPLLNSIHGAARELRQSTNEVLMVAPTAFGFNDQAAQDNRFMHSAAGASGQPGGSTRQRVLREFAGLYHELTQVAGVRVNLFEHSQAHGTPDAVFPNNWFSTHPRGEAAGGVQESTLVFYPMKCPNRQAERREDIMGVLRAKGYTRVLDLSPEEKAGGYFEGTGVLVLDRINGVVYVALSERADAKLAERWAEEMGYKELVTFQSTDAAGVPVYHTNVMMAVGTDVAVVCLESVADPKERERLRARLAATHKVIDISRAQMGAMSGNVLELQDGRGLPVMAMSSQAYHAFTEEQRRAMRQHVAALHHAPIDTLEHIGGGSVRCALGEVF